MQNMRTTINCEPPKRSPNTRARMIPTEIMNDLQKGNPLLAVSVCFVVPRCYNRGYGAQGDVCGYDPVTGNWYWDRGWAEARPYGQGLSSNESVPNQAPCSQALARAKDADFAAAATLVKARDLPHVGQWLWDNSAGRAMLIQRVVSRPARHIADIWGKISPEHRTEVIKALSPRKAIAVTTALL